MAGPARTPLMTDDEFDAVLADALGPGGSPPEGGGQNAQPTSGGRSSAGPTPSPEADHDEEEEEEEGLPPSPPIPGGGRQDPPRAPGPRVVRDRRLPRNGAQARFDPGPEEARTPRQEQGGSGAGGAGGQQQPPPGSPDSLGATTRSYDLPQVREQEIRIVVRDFPEQVEEYRRWRFQTCASYVASAMDVLGAKRCLARVEDHEIPFEELYTGRDTAFDRHDVKLFLAAVQSLKGSHANKHMLAIETRVAFGSGLQCLRLLDVSMALHGERLALSATQELHALQCSDIGNLEESLGRYELLMARIPSMDPIQGFEHLRRLLRGIPQVSFALQSALSAPPSPTRSETLLTDVRRAVADWKFDKSMTRTSKKKDDQGTAAAAGKNDKKGKRRRKEKEKGGEGRRGRWLWRQPSGVRALRPESHR